MPSTSQKSQSVLRNPKEALIALSIAGRAMLLLLVVGWCVWFAPFDDLLDRSGTPLGADYVMLYVSGETLLAGEVDKLYDDRANQVRTSAHFPTMNPDESWPYRYPPITAWLMQGLSRVNFPLSFAIFFGMCTASVCVATWMLLRSVGISDPKIRNLAFWSIVGWPIVGETLLGGQSSPVALCLVVASVVAMRANRDILAGALLGLCIYKPNIVGVLVIGILAVSYTHLTLPTKRIV